MSELFKVKDKELGNTFLIRQLYDGIGISVYEKNNGFDSQTCEFTFDKRQVRELAEKLNEIAAKIESFK